MIETSSLDRLFDLLSRPSCMCDERDIPAFRHAPDLSRRLKAVHLRHPEIEQHSLRRKFFGGLNPVDAAVCSPGHETLGTQAT